MGLLAKTMLEVMTDRLYQRLYSAFLANMGALLSANTEEGLGAYLDEATGDIALQGALFPSIADVDAMGLKTTEQAMAGVLTNWPQTRAFLAAVTNYVRSADGGSYASLAAYLDDNSVLLHPVIAEMIRAAQGEAALTLSGATVAAMPPLQQCVAFDRVYTGAFGALTDDTTDAGDTDTADVALFAANGDKLILKSRSKFSRILVGLSTLASADVAWTATYWNGSAWAALVLTDPTVGLTVQGGMISFTAPDDWVPNNDDDDSPAARVDSAEEGEYYTVILTRTEATVVTPPVATWLLTVPEAVVNGSGALFGLPQPPLAIVRITDTNTCVVTAIQNPSTRFLLPSATGTALKLRALTAIAEDLTFTLGYKDQAGAASTQAQSAWSGAKAAGATKDLSLGADTGLSEITAATCAIVTTATSGAFAIEVSAFARTINDK
jgi:hypothetical protein